MPAKGNKTKDTAEHKALKNKARALGLQFGPRLGYEKLLKLVEEREAALKRMESQEAQGPEEGGGTVITTNPPTYERAPEPAVYTVPEKLQEPAEEPKKTEAVQEDLIPLRKPVTAPPVYPKGTKLYYTSAEWRAKKTRQARSNAGRLVRCRITCMNPNKKNWTGEILSVGSAKMGTFKKFIPYGSSEPYHIPYALYQFMKERQCRVGYTVKGPNGQEINRYKLINEYSIDVLDPLSPSELNALKQRQAMAAGGA